MNRYFKNKKARKPTRIWDLSLDLTFGSIL